MSDTPAKCFNGQKLENLVAAADELAKAAKWMSNPNDGKTGYDGTALRKALADYEVAREIKRESITEVYAIMGLKGHGKDTFANLVKKFNPEFTTISMAKALKDQAGQIFNLTEGQMYDLNLKEKPLASPVKMDDFVGKMREVTGLDIQPAEMVAKSPRQLLQFYGTEYVRKASSTYWTDKVVEYILAKGGKVLVPDCRFQNEVDVLRDLNAKVIRIQRLDLADPEDMHPSEQEGKEIQPDLLIGTVWSRYGLQENIAKYVAEGDFDSAMLMDYRKLSGLIDNLLSNPDSFNDQAEFFMSYYHEHIRTALQLDRFQSRED